MALKGPVSTPSGVCGCKELSALPSWPAEQLFVQSPLLDRELLRTQPRHPRGRRVGHLDRLSDKDRSCNQAVPTPCPWLPYD
jgi:hypothetical protein